MPVWVLFEALGFTKLSKSKNWTRMLLCAVNLRLSLPFEVMIYILQYWLLGMHLNAVFRKNAIKPHSKLMHPSLWSGFLNCLVSQAECRDWFTRNICRKPYGKKDHICLKEMSCALYPPLIQETMDVSKWEKGKRSTC